MQIETRTSLFYQASGYNELRDSDKAKKHLNFAMAESGTSIEKFVSSQLFQDENTREHLSLSLNSI